MTTTEPEISPPAEPEGDEGGEAVQLVRTGWVRCTVGGSLYRLRPPFFGEFKRLRLSFEEIQDALAEQSEEVETIAARLIDEAEVMSKDESLDAAERQRRHRALRRESTVAGRKLTEFREGLMHAWWVDVFTVLCVDKPVDWLEDADRMPTWMTAAVLPSQLLQHWRAAPLGRG